MGQNRPDADVWWRRWPGLLEAELAAFARRRASTKLLAEQHGVLIMEVSWPIVGSDPIRLNVGFSPFHPFCRPEVSARDLRLDRHQNPFSGGLCLLTPEPDQWRPYQRVADCIAEQLPKILSAVEARQEGRWTEAAEVEEQAPDPVSPYYAHLCEPTSAVYFPEAQAVPAASFGIARFIVQNRQEGATPPFEAMLRRVEPVSDKWLAPEFALPKLAGSWTPVVGRWVRLTPPFPSTAEAILDAAETEIARQAALMPAELEKMKKLGDAEFCITGVLFQEEIAYGPGQTGDGWLFVVTRRQPGSRGRRKVTLARGFRISDDMFARLPVAHALRSKKVLLVGCGAIGSFAALEFARAGIGKLTIVDFDVVEPGNSVRWPLGRQAWGVEKRQALGGFVHMNYPWTDVFTIHARIGDTTSDPAKVEAASDNPLRQLRKLIQEVDVVVDTTASTECQLALAFTCRDLGTPYVVGHATEGAVGGVVARFLPGATSCRVCLDEHWQDGSLPAPPVNPAGTVLPVGCNAPTFTGGSFDLQEVTLEVVRSAIGLLAPDAYDPGDWQLAVLSLTKDGRRTLPTWVAENIPPHPRCCGAA